MDVSDTLQQFNNQVEQRTWFTESIFKALLVLMKCVEIQSADRKTAPFSSVIYEIWQ